MLDHHLCALCASSRTSLSFSAPPRLRVNKKRQRNMPKSVRFSELVAATNFSFLRGASHPSDMVGEAIALGMRAIGIADRNTVAGVVRAHVALRQAREQWN